MHGNMEHQQENKSESGYQRAKSNQHDQKKHRDGARDNPKPNQSKQTDCDSDMKVSFPTTGSWEPLDPWLFLDRTELGGVSQTCKRSHQLVGEYTPFLWFSKPDAKADSMDIVKPKVQASATSRSKVVQFAPLPKALPPEHPSVLCIGDFRSLPSSAWERIHAPFIVASRNARVSECAQEVTIDKLLPSDSSAIDSSELRREHPVEDVSSELANAENNREIGEMVDRPRELPNDIKDSMNHCLASFAPQLPGVYHAALADEIDRKNRRKEHGEV